MSLQIRRGTENQRTSMPLALAQGELAYTTDTKRLFVGDGATIGGTPVAPVTSVNGFNGVVVLTADSLANGDTNKFFSNALSNAATASLLVNSTHTGLTISYNSQTSVLTLTNSNINNTGTAKALAYYAAAGKTISGTSSVTWDESLNILEILNGQFKSTSNIGNVNTSVYDTYSSTGYSAVVFRKARGTNVIPTAIVGGDQYYSLQWQAYDGAGFNPVISITGGSILNSTITTGVVPSVLRVSIDDAVTGVGATRLAIDGYGVLYVGPYLTTDLGSGNVVINQTVSSSTTPTITVKNFFSDANGASISLRKSRGTIAAPTTVLNGDTIGRFSTRAFDGTNFVTTSLIDIVVDGTVSTGKIPSSITFNITDLNNTRVRALKIGSDSTLTHTGTITTTSAPGTIWNYDSSSSTITMTLGQSITFANFSGTVLVNCYNSGTVTQYFCGGGGAPIVHGSSKVTNTGTMASASGSNGYTFTSTEAGVHSFYVIRTRTGA